MRNTTRRTVGVAAATACTLASIGIGQALAASDPASPAVFTKTPVANLVGAAFVVSGDVNSDVRPELVASSFGPFAGPFPQRAGTVTLYNNAFRSAAPGGAIDSWTPTEIVPISAGIYGPNRPTLSDVDGDGDIDVIVPGGNFFRSFGAAANFTVGSGTLTWWEQRANGRTWLRHDVITNSNFTGAPVLVGTPPNLAPLTTTRNYSFHGVQHVDLDGDGIRDLVTVGEDGGNPSAPDDVVATIFLKGLGGGQFADFASRVELSARGGSLPVVSDINSDGKLDIATAQFFGNVAGEVAAPPFVPRTPDLASFVWLKQGDDGTAGLSAADFTAHTIGVGQGPSFQIVPVPNLRGDGITRWVGTNHTNTNVTTFPLSLYPEPAVYEFTPQPGDATLPWTVRTLSTTGSFPVCGAAGQAAPGGVGAGDLDGDGDIDLAVSGDGSRFVYWLEQKPNPDVADDSVFATNTMPGTNPPGAPSPPPPGCLGGFGQAGGSLVVDLNRDGINEAVWGSFDAGQVAIWKR